LGNGPAICRRWARSRFAYANYLLYSGQAGSPEMARQALGIAQRALETFEELGGSVGVRVWLLFHLGQALALNREWDEARNTLERALAIARKNPTFPHMVADTHIWLAHLALAVGDLGRARRELDTGFAAVNRQQLSVPLVTAHVVRARCGAHLGVEIAGTLQQRVAVREGNVLVCAEGQEVKGLGAHGAKGFRSEPLTTHPATPGVGGLLMAPPAATGRGAPCRGCPQARTPAGAQAHLRGRLQSRLPRSPPDSRSVGYR
jgi:hypothetical protein